MSDPYLALDRLTRHMTDAARRIDQKLAYHREHMNNMKIVALNARKAKLERAYAYEWARIAARIKRIENPPVVHRKSNRNRR